MVLTLLDKLIIVLNGVGFQLHVSTLFLVMYENRFSKIYIFMFLKNTFTTKIIYISYALITELIWPSND